MVPQAMEVVIVTVIGDSDGVEEVEWSTAVSTDVGQANMTVEEGEAVDVPREHQVIRTHPLVVTFYPVTTHELLEDSHVTYVTHLC